MPLIRHVIGLLIGLALSGCAGIMGGGEKTWIASEPAYASCTLSGIAYDKVVRTPHQVSLPKQAGPIRISCTAEGYRDTVAVLETRPNPIVFANLVFGSSIIAMIDLIKGEGQMFPTQVTIHMEPAAFPSLAVRDAWYGRFRHSVKQRWNRILTDMEMICDDGRETPLDCLDRIKQAKNGAAAELQRLEQRRLAAHIIPKELDIDSSHGGKSVLRAGAV